MGHYPRIVIPGILHHIVHRGNNRKRIFYDDEDYDLYLALLKHYSNRHDFKMLSFCLMTNHVHLVGIPVKKTSISNLVRDTHQRYSYLINQKMSRSGHNWEDRFRSFPCDDYHGVASMLYSEQNPMRAGMVHQAWDYKWSSANIHLGLIRNPGLLDLDWWNARFIPVDWKTMLKQDENPELTNKIQRSIKSSIPLGDDEFHNHIEKLLGISIKPKPMGRPSKSK